MAIIIKIEIKYVRMTETNIDGLVAFCTTLVTIWFQRSYLLTCKEK